MALRMRRRRTLELGREAAELVQEAAREGVQRASDVATAAIEGASGRQSHRGRRVGLGMLALLLIAALATGLYVWWNRRREDEEYARLLSVPDEPRTSPAAPPSTPPASATDATDATDVAPTGFAPAREPVTAAEPTPAVAQAAAPAPQVATTPVESQVEHVQRPAWNNHRDVPLFVLPPRPAVPFRGAATPSADRARLPGTASSFLR